MSKLLIPPAVLLLVLMALLSSDQDDTAADLVLASDSEIFTLDPQRMSWLADMRMGYALFEGLTKWDTTDFSCHPAVATGWTVSQDGRTWTFDLDPEARWSNGAPVTAHDFLWSWKRLLMPDTAADYTDLLHAIDGGEAFFTWRANALQNFDPTHDDAEALIQETDRRFADTVGLVALDDHRLQITLAHPVPYLLDLVAFVPLMPVYRPAVEGWPENPDLIHGWHLMQPPSWSDRQFVELNSKTGRIEADHHWARPGTLISNGPFSLDRWRYRRDLRLVRHPHRKDGADAPIQSVLVRSYPDPTTALLAYRSGEVDWLTGVSADMRRELVEARRVSDEQDPDLLTRSTHAKLAYGTEYVGFNCRPTLGDGRPNPFHDAGVRRAFAAATDKQTLVDMVSGLGDRVTGMFTPAGSIEHYNPQGGINFDIARAKEELAAAGWTYDSDGRLINGEGDTFPVVDLMYSTYSPRYQRLCTGLRDQWIRNLGVDVHLKGQDSKFFGADLREGNFMVARGGWYGDWGDPTTWLNMFRGDDGNNDRGFKHPDIETRLNEAKMMADQQARLQSMARIEEDLFQEHLPLIPICQLVDVSMYDPWKLQGMTKHPRLVQYVADITMVSPAPESDAP